MEHRRFGEAAEDDSVERGAEGAWIGTEGYEGILEKDESGMNVGHEDVL
jgi:hypothetical protein